MIKWVIIGLLIVGLYFTGDSIDSCSDVSLLKYMGITKEGNLLFAKQNVIVLEYLIVPNVASARGSVSSFPYRICGKDYILEPQKSGGIRISRNE